LGGAIAVAGVYSVVGPVTLAATIRPRGEDWSDFAKAVSSPLAAAALGVLPGWSLSAILFESAPPILRLLVTAGTSALLYLPIVRRFDRVSSEELLAMLFSRRLLGAELASKEAK
jgi:hypothetical protein